MLFGRWNTDSEEKEQRDEIISWLKYANTHHCLLDVQLGKSKSKYQSMILRVDDAKGVIVLDELMPHPAEPVKCREQDRLHLEWRDRSNIYRCETSLVAVKGKHPEQTYIARIPEEVTRTQQRDAYRVHFSSAEQVPLLIVLPNMRKFKGYLLDMSVGGIAARFSSEELLNEVKSGQVVSPCMVALDDGEKLQFALKISHVELRGDKTPVTFIGARFTRLEPRVVNRIERFLARVQRKQQRKKLSD